MIGTARALLCLRFPCRPLLQVSDTASLIRPREKKVNKLDVEGTEDHIRSPEGAGFLF